MDRPPWFDLYCWLKRYWWRDATNEGREWTTYEWAKKRGDPFIAFQEGEISPGKFCEILAEELWIKGWRPTDLFKQPEAPDEG